MKVLSSIADMRLSCRAARTSPQLTLGLVPTMGALHAGHISLVRAARQSSDTVAATIFVNPTQFGPNEDLARYPRTFEADRALLEAEGVDILFAPAPDEMYPANSTGTFVEVPGLSDRLDGASRPGHFRGVATVVTKLFNIVAPDRAFFGQKDAAQVAVLQAMARDLDFGIDIVVCPTVRESEGLAMSSRNRYLKAEERSEALTLSRALRCAEDAIRAGECDAAALISKLRQHLQQAPHLRIDYIEIVNRHSLLPQDRVDHHTLITLAAYIGPTRLIDNLPVANLFSEATR